MNIIDCDIVVIGGGLAATAAVKCASAENLKTCQVVKGSYGTIGQRGSGASSCGASESGRPRLTAMPDSSEALNSLHDMIVQAGLGMVDRKLAEVMLGDFPKLRERLHGWDIRFDMKGPYHLGYPFIHAVESDVRSSAIRLFERTMITDLLIQDGKCAGAVGVTESEDIFLFRAPAVIIATGGDAQLFQHNVHPDCVTGDGYAMGFRAGAELLNMEFMQIFFCTVYPTRNLFHAWHQEALSNLYNKDGEPFLSHYLPAGISEKQCIAENVRHAPFSTRDRASRYLGIAIVKEVQAGRGSEHGGTFCDVTSASDMIPDLQERFLRARGIDVRKTPIQITMGHQCSNGGLRISVDAMTTIPGVFAAGEATTGMHGADRLGGNLLSACLVFGVRAAESAIDWAKRHSVPRDTVRSAREELAGIAALSSSKGKTSPTELLRVLQKSAWDHALTVRSEASLAALLCDIRQLQDEFQLALCINNRADLIRALELKNLLLVGELVARAAMKRQESRGGHYREDFPECNYQDHARAVVLKQSKNQSIQVAEEIVDPAWQHIEDNLGEKRWG